MKGTGLKIALSIFAVFHVACVALAPLPESLVHDWIRPFTEPYLNGLGLGAHWEFFAPDPRNARLFVEWELLNAEGQPIGKGQWPDPESPYWLSERHNRRVFFAAFLVAHQLRVDRVIGPWACRSPGAHSVRLWRASYPLAPLPSKGLPTRDLAAPAETREWISHTFCNEGEGSP